MIKAIHNTAVHLQAFISQLAPKPVKRHDLTMTSDLPLEYIFHHVFLPPKLPDKEDERERYDVVLTQLCQQELEKFHDFLPSDQRQPVKRMVETMKGMVLDLSATAAPFSNIVKGLKTMKTEGTYIHPPKDLY